MSLKAKEEQSVQADDSNIPLACAKSLHKQKCIPTFLLLGGVKKYILLQKTIYLYFPQSLHPDMPKHCTSWYV